MKYRELINELENQHDAELLAYEVAGNELDEWRERGFFYRLTHRRELREFRNKLEAASHNLDEITRELAEYRDLYDENINNAQNQMHEQVMNQIEDYAAKNGLYLANDFSLINYPDLINEANIPEENPQFNDYTWSLTHGDSQIDRQIHNLKSVQEVIDNADEYGDMIPVSLENQFRIIGEIRAAFYFDEHENVSLQNSDHGLQVVVSEVDGFGQGNPLLNKKISYDELTEHIAAFKESDFKSDGKRMFPGETELDKGLKKNLEAAKEELSQKGLFFSREIYASQSGPTFDDYSLTIDYQTFSKYGDRLNGIPTKDEIVSFAEKNEIVTKISPEEQKTLEEEFNKITFGSDEAVYSYSTFVGDLFEDAEGPCFLVYDDSDYPFASLRYDSEADQWFNKKHEFEVNNPVSSLKEKYPQVDPTTEFSEVLSNMNKSELDLMKLIDNERNEDIDNSFADAGNSSFEAKEVLEEFVDRIKNSKIYDNIKSIYEKHVHGYIDNPPKGKVDIGVAGSMITKTLEEKNAEFFGISNDQKVVEGDPEVLGYFWGLTSNKNEPTRKPTLQDYAREVEYYKKGKHPEAMDVNFHVWTISEEVDRFGEPRKMSTQGVVNIVNEVMRNEQSQELIDGLPEGWRWRTYTDGSGSMLSPEGDHYFSFRQDQDGVLYSNPETGEKEYSTDISEFRKNSKQWVENSLLVYMTKEQNQTARTESRLEPELEM